jgi:hypothetical protein
MALHSTSVLGIVRASIQAVADANDVTLTIGGNHVEFTNLSAYPLLYSTTGLADSWSRIPGQKSASKGEPVRIYTGSATSLYVRGIYAPYGEGRPTQEEPAPLPGRRHSFTATDLSL